MNRGQIPIWGVVFISAAFTATAGKFVDYIFGVPKVLSLTEKKIDIVDARVDKLCTFTTNQSDRMDKNLQAIAKKLGVPVVTGNDKDDPCKK